MVKFMEHISELQLKWLQRYCNHLHNNFINLINLELMVNV